MSFIYYLYGGDCGEAPTLYIHSLESMWKMGRAISSHTQTHNDDVPCLYLI